MDTKRKIHIGMTGMMGLASLTCILGSWLFISDIRESRDCPSWPGIDGKIVRSEVLKKGCKSRREFRPVVEYSYQVEGAVYRSHRLQINEIYRCGSYGETRTYLEKYPMGGSVRVFYNPKHPEKSILFRDKVSFFWHIMVGVLWVMGLAFGFGALSGLVVMFAPPEMVAEARKRRP